MGVVDRLRNWLTRGLSEAPTSGGSSGAKRDPGQTTIKKLGLALGDTSDFEATSDYNMTTISNAYATEAYVRQAVDKYIELMFKAGWDFVGKNPNAVAYLKQRFAMMAEVTQIPTDQMFIEIAEDLVKYANAVIVKKRADDPNSLPPGVTVQGLGGNQPIAGYFPLNVTTLSVKRDKNGVVKNWQQEVEDQDKAVKFKAQDVIHIYYKREKGAAFGTSFIIPVLDDIRSLRQAEDNVLKMIYRNLFPYIHVQVGLPQEGMYANDSDIRKVQSDIQSVDLEAGLVTSERVNIKPIANDQIIDANPYLKYFEQRVFTGLGVSELMMGRGNTANRSTGDNLSGEFTDRVKAFQKVMAAFLDQFMIKELLMEGGFDAITNPDDEVRFVFKEIDFDAKVKAENHYIYQYEHNAINEDEMRELLGRDVMTDRAKLFMNLVTIPTATAKSAATGANAEPGTPAGNNKNKPTNQNGTKTSPKKTAASTAFEDTEYHRIIENEYTLLNQGINILVEEYYAGKNEVVSEFSGVIAYTENRMREIAEEYLTDEVTADISYPLTHAMTYLHDTLVEAIEPGNGSEAALRAQETVNAVFMVMYDRIAEIAQGAYNRVYEGGEEVG